MGSGARRRLSGAAARSWYGHLRPDIDAVTVDGGTLRIVDSDTPGFLIESWMALDNRVSTVSLARIDAVYDQPSGPIYVVRGDGHLVQVVFRPLSVLVSGPDPGGWSPGGGRSPRVDSSGVCLGGEGRLLYRPKTGIAGVRLAIRACYPGYTDGPIAVAIAAQVADRPSNTTRLHPQRRSAELVDLGLSGVQAMAVGPAPRGGVCFGGLEIGSLTAHGD